MATRGAGRRRLPLETPDEVAITIVALEARDMPRLAGVQRIPERFVPHYSHGEVYRLGSRDAVTCVSASTRRLANVEPRRRANTLTLSDGAPEIHGLTTRTNVVPSATVGKSGRAATNRKLRLAPRRAAYFLTANGWRTHGSMAGSGKALASPSRARKLTWMWVMSLLPADLDAHVVRKKLGSGGW